uniref:Ig-like domain-containing protein n=1 Tax=Mesocestoides corti TaxID=53468 RepID=A0A5K3G3H0_MESCO
ATVLPPDDSSNIDQYKITVKVNDKTKSCVVDAKTGPLDCTFDGLPTGTKCTVVACSWNAAGQICSDSLESVVWSKPNGKFALPASPL